LPPLFDGINVAKEIRNQYREALRNSSDPYNRDYPDVRASQSHFRAMAVKKQACVEDQYLSKVVQAFWKYDPQSAFDVLDLDPDINNGINVDTAALLQQAAVDMDLPSDAEPLVTPFGTASARIGVVLERCLVRTGDSTENLKNGVCALPDLFWNARFTESNSLIWTSDLRQTLRKLPTSQEDHNSKVSECLTKFHQILIYQSNPIMIMIAVHTQRLYVCRL
jgi:hypothetical protein